MNSGVPPSSTHILPQVPLVELGLRLSPEVADPAVFAALLGCHATAGVRSGEE